MYLLSRTTSVIYARVIYGSSDRTNEWATL
jgi:hypothetical protein